VRPPRVTLAADVAVSLTDRVQLPRLRLVWHAPALFAPGDADLDLAAHVLGGGKSSRLYKSLVFERRIAQDVFAYQGSQVYGSLFHVGATAKPGHDMPEIQAAVDAEIARLASDGPTDEELTRARNSHLADFYKSLDYLQTRADLLNHYQHVLGEPGGVARDVARYEQATAASVRDAFAAAVGAKRLALQTLPEPVTA
jgi:zinc protease